MWTWFALVLSVSAVHYSQGERSAPPGVHTALLIIDVQECFLPTGSLPVSEGNQVIPVINQIRRDLDPDLALIVLTQDWHCPDHVSFASQHKGYSPLSRVNLTYNRQGQLCREGSVSSSYPHGVNCSESDVTTVVTQTLWPDHCVQNVTTGPTSATLSPSLTLADRDVVVPKGFHCDVDSYSAFYDNGGFRQTELHALLKHHGVGIVIVTGLALDYCVYYTAMDAHKLGYTVVVVTDASRGVNPATIQDALQDMNHTGVHLVRAVNLQAKLTALTSSAVRSAITTIAILLVVVMTVSVM